MTKTTNQFGELGERIAARWLECHGYTILARRWRSGHRDIDVIAERDGVVAFVEVKTRAALEFGDPVEAVHAQKQRSLVRSAREWMARSNEGSTHLYRFDVIGILLRDRTAWVRHIESAFTV
jgi:putative endonuclease